MDVVVTYTLRGRPRIMQAVRTERGWDGWDLRSSFFTEDSEHPRDGTDPADLPGMTGFLHESAPPLRREYSAVLRTPQVYVLPPLPSGGCHLAAPVVVDCSRDNLMTGHLWRVEEA